MARNLTDFQKRYVVRQIFDDGFVKLLYRCPYCNHPDFINSGNLGSHLYHKHRDQWERLLVDQTRTITIEETDLIELIVAAKRVAAESEYMALHYNQANMTEEAQIRMRQTERLTRIAQELERAV